MGNLTIERIGGLGGFGLPGSRVRSHGSKSSETLSSTDQAAVEALFRTGGQPATRANPDGFRYRITRVTKAGPETIEVPEAEVPPALKDTVRDELQ